MGIRRDRYRAHRSSMNGLIPRRNGDGSSWNHGRCDESAKDRAFRCGTVLVCAASVAQAETWSAVVGIEMVEPLASWQGGIVCVKLDTPLVTTQCSTTTIVDFVFTQ